ncbi:hypothetical protein S7711_04844 [Stachybotrys chartarum IBT 7711]|uniref:Uncharacterized protein n=1 Tax=Stachybotrys chartarum (strain CBS 109288 / IBT 7711) TaxID=1280523 RepID=A0A084AMI9_STACB|nr:hypothetical protein S7711_04844 [Stachybotrys chartarum IBT 7711]KFA51077.1 hypothetical protein S40293_08226 [Stachybotrys chartarum IBT 40293]KFA78460.1 hypothetical protein S40288_06922 [Stachybotrys chartarum IBT 40288]
MMLHGAQSLAPPSSPSQSAIEGLGRAQLQPPSAPLLGRKRKAETQENERLNKRLSLLNLEHNGPKLYVPVETPSVASTPSVTTNPSTPAQDDTMQLDESKHKVYIYNIDDELSSDSEGDEAKLVFLPDIEKHLKESRIPRHILANQDGELAGMQVVLYSDPTSLSVPVEQDSVRKAIIESRRRLREKQKLDREGTPQDDLLPPHHYQPDSCAHAIPAQDADAMDMD